jgi:hypothetical protein
VAKTTHTSPVGVVSTPNEGDLATTKMAKGWFWPPLKLIIEDGGVTPWPWGGSTIPHLSKGSGSARVIPRILFYFYFYFYFKIILIRHMGRGSFFISLT